MKENFGKSVFFSKKKFTEIYRLDKKKNLTCALRRISLEMFSQPHYPKITYCYYICLRFVITVQTYNILLRQKTCRLLDNNDYFDVKILLNSYFSF